MNICFFTFFGGGGTTYFDESSIDQRLRIQVCQLISLIVGERILN